jgi:uncharacterized membrane protein
MASQIIIDVLAYGHVLSAMGWLGGGILLSFVLVPSLRNLAPAAALEFNAKVLPKVLRFMQTVVGSTLIFGILLFYVVSDQLGPDQTNEIYAGIGLALVAGVIAFAVVLPSLGKVVKLAGEALQSGQPPSPEMMKRAKRAGMGSLIAAALLLIVLAMMIASGFS